MGIFDRSESSDEEVAINPESSGSGSESRLRSEVESKVASKNNSSKGKNRSDSTVSSVASGSQVSTQKQNGVSVEDVYRQNEKIIQLLEQLVDEDDDSGNEDFEGDLNGVL